MKLPTYQEAESRVQDPNETASLLDIFIYNHSSTDYAEQSTFRWNLQRVLDHLEVRMEEEIKARLDDLCDRCGTTKLFAHYMFETEERSGS